MPNAGKAERSVVPKLSDARQDLLCKSEHWAIHHLSIHGGRPTMSCGGRFHNAPRPGFFFRRGSKAFVDYGHLLGMNAHLSSKAQPLGA
jgi:hypothetical protein